MDAKTCQAQTAHIRRCLAALRLFDLRELEQCVHVHGSREDQDLVAALLLALETLPDDPHG
jgi:hypothetical protein